jgi:ClpP class serine protease
MHCLHIFAPAALLMICMVATAQEQKPLAASNKVAHIQIAGEISHGPAHPEQGRVDKKLGTILGRLEKAAKDPSIKVIFLELRGVDCGHATAEELRQRGL